MLNEQVNMNKRIVVSVIDREKGEESEREVLERERERETERGTFIHSGVGRSG